MKKSNFDRWVIAIKGTLLQIVLGTVYAWSYFQKPIMDEYGWSNVQIMWIFSEAILFLGLSAAMGGMILPRCGPRVLATIGALLYGMGYLISAYALHISSLPLFYTGFGVAGGIGLGLGYVTPVATVLKWFPDKKGFITGMVVMGFGLGALVMSKFIAPLLISIFNDNMAEVFFYIGIIVMGIGIPAGFSMKNPPTNFVPHSNSSPIKYEISENLEDNIDLKESLFSTKFLGMWLIFFLNISAGIIFIGLQSPMIQDLLKIHDSTMSTQSLAAAGASLIAISSLFNGMGRFFWGAISDKIGRIQVFRLIFSSQILVFILMIFTDSPWIFGALVCYVLLCYGGGFGAMPSYVIDVFHAPIMPVIYGVILTAWAMAGIAGPQMAAFIRDHYSDTPEMIGPTTYVVGITLLGIGFMISLALSNKSITTKSRMRQNTSPFRRRRSS